jgi:hypothetical protein
VRIKNFYYPKNTTVDIEMNMVWFNAGNRANKGIFGKAFLDL